VRTSAWIAVSAVSLSAISVSYAKGVVPEDANGLAPLAPVATGNPSPSSTADPTSSQSAAPQPSSSASASAAAGGGSGNNPAPKPSKSTGSSGSSASSTPPKPNPPPAPKPVIKTVNSDVINYVTNGLQKNLQISVTFSDATITDIQILQGDTNNGIGKAYPVLIQAAISAQGTAFGNYTGATYTTNAFKTAVSNAISKR